jgi:hypothetical protein
MEEVMVLSLSCLPPESFGIFIDLIGEVFGLQVEEKEVMAKHELAKMVELQAEPQEVSI